jgi:hypothetical protein
MTPQSRVAPDPRGPASVSFSVGAETVTIALPEPGDPGMPSAFVIGLPKAGSTLLHSMMQSIGECSGLSYFSLATEARRRGVHPQQIPPATDTLYVPYGYLYGGFRGLPPKTTIPQWASGRTILLVRDPRDMVVSLYFSQAYSHTPPGSAGQGKLRAEFYKKRERAISSSIDEFALENAKLISHIFDLVRTKLHELDHKLYRYEDVIFDKLNWLSDMVDYLKIPAKQMHVQSIARRFDKLPETENPGEHIRNVKPGDHRNKLQYKTIMQLNDVWSGILSEFQYSRQ